MTPSRQQIRCQKSARVQGRRNTAVIQLLTADIPIAFEPGHELTSATICPQLGTLRVHRGGCGRGTGLAKRTGAQPSWIERLDRLADELAKARVLPEKAMRKVFWQMMGALDGFVVGPNRELGRRDSPGARDVSTLRGRLAILDPTRSSRAGDGRCSGAARAEPH